MNTHRILVAWHQLYLVPFDVSPQFVGDGVGTLIAAAAEPGHLIVRTGCATGPVRVTLTSLPTPPVAVSDAPAGGAVDAEDPWEAIEEVSLPVKLDIEHVMPRGGAAAASAAAHDGYGAAHCAQRSPSDPTERPSSVASSRL